MGVGDVVQCLWEMEVPGVRVACFCVLGTDACDGCNRHGMGMQGMVQWGVGVGEVQHLLKNLDAEVHAG